MSLALHDLLACCRALENDKATERKVKKTNYCLSAVQINEFIGDLMYFK